MLSPRDMTWRRSISRLRWKAYIYKGSFINIGYQLHNFHEPKPSHARRRLQIRQALKSLSAKLKGGCGEEVGDMKVEPPTKIVSPGAADAVAAAYAADTSGYTSPFIP